MDTEPSMTDGAPSLDPKRRKLLLGLTLLASFLVYANTLTNGFVSDDHQQIEGNPYAHSFRYVGKIFTTTVWSFQGKEGQTNYYRPLMTFGYVLCSKIFQTYPFGFHLMNLFLNCAAVWLVLRLGERVFGDERVAFTAALFFAFHPIHCEAVAWIAAVTELQLAIFFLLTFLLFLRLGDPNAKPITYALMCGSFLLALFSKEQAVTLPVLATIYEHCYREDRAQTSRIKKVIRYGGLWALSGVYLLFRVLVLRGFAPVVQRPDLTIGELALSGLALIGQYIVRLFWPHPLVAFHLFQKSARISDPYVGVAIVFVAVLIVLVLALWKYARPYSFWPLWMGVTLAPVLNVRWMAASAFAERYLYLPSVGFCFLLANGVVWLWKRAGHRVWFRATAGTAAVLVLVMSAVLIIKRNRQWRDDESLITADLALQPHASYLRANLGAIEWSRKHKQRAIEQWKIALVDKPDNPIALCNLGMAMIDEKKWPEAEELLKRAIALRPRFASPHVYLGDLYLQQERSADAEAEYRRAVDISPLNIEARNRLGDFYAAQDRKKEAEEQFRASLDAQPNAKAWSGLGDALLQQDRKTEAAVAWSEAIELEPFDEHTRLELGQVYREQRRYADAEEQFRVVLLLDPRNEVALASMHEIKPAEFPKP
jgi:protein O-mannosyl-transferase